MFFVPFCQMMLTFTSSKEISNTFSRTNRLVTLVTETQTMLNKNFKLYRMTHQQKKYRYLCKTMAPGTVVANLVTATGF